MHPTTPLAVLLATALLAHTATAGPEILTLDAEQQRRMHIESAPVAAADRVALESLAGEVQLPLDRSMALAAPYAGRVLKVLADDGDAVAAGQTLAVVASRDFADARARAAKARAEVERLRAQAARERSLFAAGVIPATRVEAGAAALRAAEAEVAAAAAGLAGLHEAEGGAYAIVAPEAARVVERRIRPGEPVDATTVAFTLVTAAALRLELRVPATEAARIAIGDRVEAAGVEGRITGKGMAIDPESQTVKLRAELPAGGGLLPGERITARIFVQMPEDAVRVPRTALARENGAANVFRIDGGRITPVPVVVLTESGADAIVRGALRVGDPVVVSGVSALKAASAK